MSDIQTQDQKQTVDILVEFPWGREVIERITYTDSHFLGDLTTEDKQVFEVIVNLLKKTKNFQLGYFFSYCSLKCFVFGVKILNC